VWIKTNLSIAEQTSSYFQSLCNELFHEKEFLMAKTATKVSSTKAPAKKAAAPKAAAKASGKAAKVPAKTAGKAAAPKATARAAATKASAAGTASVLTLRHLAEQLSEAHELPKRQANEMLTQVIEMIAKSLKKGEKIRLTGLGILQVRKRAARTGRNPQTGEPIKIKAPRRSPSGPPRSSRKPFDPCRSDLIIAASGQTTGRIR
jgi:DNA-binding protein HU-beta